MFLSAQGPIVHSPPLCALHVHFLGLSALLTPPGYYQAGAGNPDVPGSRETINSESWTQIFGSSQALLLAICPTGGGHSISICRRKKADNARLVGARKGAVRRPQAYLAEVTVLDMDQLEPPGGCGCHSY